MHDAETMFKTSVIAVDLDVFGHAKLFDVSETLKGRGPNQCHGDRAQVNRAVNLIVGTTTDK